MINKSTEIELEVLNIVTDLIPDLKVCALLLQRAKVKKLRFPIKTHDSLIDLLDKDFETIDVHILSGEHIKRYIAKEYFPINDWGELARAIYIGLSQCRFDMHWAASAPPNAEQLLKFYK